MNKYNQNTIKVSIFDENGEELPVMQYMPFQDGSDREVLPSRKWERNLMASAPIQMKELWILHQTGYKGTPMAVIMSGLTASIQHDLLMDWYKLKGITRPCIRPQNKFTREELETINECRKRGVPYKQIAEKLNHRHTVRAVEEVWVRTNPDRRKRVQREYSQEELETIKKLREEGLTYRAIADKVNRKPGSVQAACKGYTKHSLRSMKQKLNEVALKVYGHRFSTLMNWKDGKERQKVVREIVEGRNPLSTEPLHMAGTRPPSALQRTPQGCELRSPPCPPRYSPGINPSSIKEVLQNYTPAREFKHLIVFISCITKQYKLCCYHIFNRHSYHHIY